MLWCSHIAAMSTQKHTLGLRNLMQQLSDPFKNASASANHDHSFWNCGIGPPGWQSINSLDTEYSTFKWSPTWPQTEKTAETKHIAAWRPILYLDVPSYFAKFYCLTWWTWNHWLWQVITSDVCLWKLEQPDQILKVAEEIVWFCCLLCYFHDRIIISSSTAPLTGICHEAVLSTSTSQVPRISDSQWILKTVSLWNCAWIGSNI